jgi:hypothetical protein
VRLDSGDDVVSIHTNEESSAVPAAVKSGDRIQVIWRPADAFELESALV